MKFRKLRIAWSVGCLIACVLLIALWARSYWVHEGYYRIDAANNQMGFGWTVGSLGFNARKDELKWPPQKWTYFRTSLDVPYQSFRASFSNGELNFRLPFWFLSTLLLALSYVVWLPWHFSLRTLLIATTLVAVVLGLIVWSAS